MAEQVKAIIWNLDDTLWTGTLADGDDVKPKPFRADVVRTLNKRGVVNSICSKNDLDLARGKLVEFGLWDEFVFPNIGFQPKGETVAQTVEEMRLRAPNVVFVDHNANDLEEVEFSVPGIQVVNASDPGCDAALQAIVDANAHMNASRVAQYRALEQRIVDRKTYTGSNEGFLRSSDLNVCIVKSGGNLEFAPRIEELVNRSNHLNFTKSRIPEGTAYDLLSSRHKDFYPFSIFAWDKYGYHGLVGFAGIEQRSKLVHFALSYRVMQMGIEEFLLAEVQSKFPQLDYSAIPIAPRRGSWIKQKTFKTPEVREFIRARERTKKTAPPLVRVMADYQSASIAHYAGFANVTETDLHPRFFDIAEVMNWSRAPDNWPPYLVYTPASNMQDDHAPTQLWTEPLYRQYVEKFAKLVSQGGRQCLVVLPPERANAYEDKRGVTRERVEAFNAVWRDVAPRYRGLTILEISDLATAEDTYDVRRYSVPLLRKIGEQCEIWLNSRSPLANPYNVSYHVSRLFDAIGNGLGALFLARDRRNLRYYSVRLLKRIGWIGAPSVSTSRIVSGATAARDPRQHSASPREETAKMGERADPNLTVASAIARPATDAPAVEAPTTEVPTIEDVAKDSRPAPDAPASETGHQVMARLPVRHVQALLDPSDKRYSHRFISIYLAIQEVTLRGDFAEFGVFKGRCAKFLTPLVHKSRRLHLFDSFEGLPEDWVPKHSKGHFDLGGKVPKFDLRVCVIHKGLFKDTIPTFAKSLTRSLALLHLDADLYSSTMEVLDGLNDHIVPGTILLFDEYALKGTDEEHRALVDWAKARDREFEYLWRTKSVQVAVRVTR